MPDQNLTLDLVGIFASGLDRTSLDTAFKPGGYGVFDAYAKWDVADNAVLNFGVQNLFNRRYFEANAGSYSTTASASTSVIAPLELQTGAGRRFTAALDVKF